MYVVLSEAENNVAYRELVTQAV